LDAYDTSLSLFRDIYLANTHGSEREAHSGGIGESFPAPLSKDMDAGGCELVTKSRLE